MSEWKPCVRGDISVIGREVRMKGTTGSHFRVAQIAPEYQLDLRDGTTMRSANSDGYEMLVDGPEDHIILSEVLGERGIDPDDLAAAICRLLRNNGIRPAVIMRVELGSVTGIEVHVRGLQVAIFPCTPVPLGDNNHGIETLLKAIEGS